MPNFNFKLFLAYSFDLFVFQRKIVCASLPLIINKRLPPAFRTSGGNNRLSFVASPPSPKLIVCLSPTLILRKMIKIGEGVLTLLQWLHQ